jgi:hypothetical protein
VFGPPRSENPKGKSESGDASPHSKEKPKTTAASY